MLRAAALAVILARGATAASSGYYTNPLTQIDTPDPGVAYAPEDGLFYAVTTGGDPVNGAFTVRSSPDLANWTTLAPAFPPGGVPKWAVDSFWAPELHRVGATWVLIHTGRTAGGQLCVGVATSASGRAAGPYADAIGAPLLQDPSGLGTIDATLFFDTDGRLYVLAKTDGNAVGRPTPIHIAELDAASNATRFAPGESLASFYASALITDTLAWENGIVEAPWLVKFGQSYFLFYSGSGYDGPGIGISAYAVGVARAPSVRGPFTKFGPPVLANTTGADPHWQGPGHPSVLQSGDGTWAIVYHAWPGHVRSYGRHMMLDVVTWMPDGAGLPWPVVNGGQGPSTQAMPVP